MASGLFEGLTASDTWGVVIVAVVFGTIGSLVHRWSEDEPAQLWWKSGLVGIIAALASTTFMHPSTAIELVGLSLTSGFFARTVLTALETRLALELARRQAERALRIAGEAIELSRRTRGAASTTLEGDLGRLSARLDEVKGLGPT